MLVSFTDQINNSIEVSFPLKRIVSLVPSQTELLYSLGLDEEVVGITKFCVHPQRWFKTKQRVGGTKTLNVDLIKKLQPCLVIANKEENEKDQIEALQKFAPVWVSDVETLEDAIEMIQSLGQLVNKPGPANSIAASVVAGFGQLVPTALKPRTAYLIWKDPYMAAGGDTFISDIMKRCGLSNIFSSYKRYPQTTPTELRKMKCEVLILSSEPYPFRQKHIMELQQALPSAQIILADGEMFSWYGSKLLLAPTYLNKLIAGIT